VDQAREVAEGLREEDHVEAVLQAAAPEIAVADQGVLEALAVQRVARPARVLGGDPGLEQAQPRQVHHVPLDIRNGRHGLEREPQAQGHVVHRLPRGLHDPAPGRIAFAARLEGLLRRVHLVAPQEPARPQQGGLPGVAQEEDVARTLDPSTKRSLSGEGLHGRVEHLAVRDRRALDPVEERPCPGYVVVGLVRLVGRELLLLQEVDRRVPVRLVQAHHPGAGRPGALAERQVRGQAVDLDPVQAELVEQVGQAAGIPLLGREHPGIRRLGPALLQGAAGLGPEALQQLLPVEGCILQRLQHGRLHVVGVVAQRPADLLVRRPGTVPLHVGHRLAGKAVLHLAVEGAGVGVAESLVEAADGVVGVRHRGQVAGPPAVPEAPGPDAGEAQR
jgi:hypothetical protein